MKRRLTSLERLEAALGQQLTKLLNVEEIHLELYPARGYWTHNHQDVKQITGIVRSKNLVMTICSWDSVTKCLRNGFIIHDERKTDDRLRDAQIVIEAINK